jgi:hypothetical protein
MFRNITRVAVLMLFCTVAAGEMMAACRTQDADFRSTFRTGDRLGDFNDYGAIHIDADNGGDWPVDCAKRAHDALLSKLQSTPSSVWSESLADYQVALVFAAAQRIASYGWFNTATEPNGPGSTRLSDELQEVIDSYSLTHHSGPCGFGGNGCLDDYAGQAAAYAWIAAFKKQRGDTGGAVPAMLTASHTAMNNFFSYVCIHDRTEYNANPAGGVCNATIEDLGGWNLTGPAKVFSFEHEQQTPHYGLGLMTTIASAFAGVKIGGGDLWLTEDQKIQARAIFREVQEHTNASFEYTNDCKKPTKTQSGVFTGFGADVPCKDFNDLNWYGRGYDPRMYHLEEFYDRFVGMPGQFSGIPDGNYRSDDTCCTDYPYWRLDKYDSNWGPGRYTSYRDQGWKFIETYDDLSRYMPPDANPADGYLDYVTSNGHAHGWACDADAPNSWVKVDLYANGQKVADDHQSQYGWWPSHTEVNERCGGGTAHHFQIALPPWTQGKVITAKARDFTFGPDVSLPCLTSSCSW